VILLNSIFLRRLLLPLVGVLFTALTIVAIVALIELLPENTSDASHGRSLIVLSASALALIFAMAWATWIVWRYRRSEGQAMRGVIGADSVLCLQMVEFLRIAIIQIADKPRFVADSPVLRSRDVYSHAFVGRFVQQFS